MIRVTLLLFGIFALLLILRTVRIFLSAFFGERLRRRGPPAVEAEMVRDPVCGTWIDRRLALAARRGAEWVPVCSEKCRGRLELEAR